MVNHDRYRNASCGLSLKCRCELSPATGLCTAPRPFNKVVQLVGTFFSPLRGSLFFLGGCAFSSVQRILIRRPFDNTVQHYPLQPGSWLPTLNQPSSLSTFSCAERAPETGLDIQRRTLPLDVFFNPQIGCLLQDVTQTSPSTRHGCRFKLPSL